MSCRRSACLSIYPCAVVCTQVESACQLADSICRTGLGSRLSVQLLSIRTALDMSIDGDVKAKACSPSQRAESTMRYQPRHPMVAGAITGGIEIMITFPLEFIKVQLQLQHLYKQSEFGGPVECALYTVRHKGATGLYKGLTPWLVFALPRSSVRFATYEFVGAQLQGDGQKLSPLQAMLAGTIAGGMEFATVGTPMSCIQIKMAHDAYSTTPKFRGFLHATTSIVRDEGWVRGLYGGVGPTVLKGAVNNCIRFGTFNEMKHMYLQAQGRTDDAEGGVALHPLESLGLGAISGGLSAIATHPIDTVKSNMQALGSGGYSSSWDCIKSIIREQGVPGLYKGLAPRFVRVCLEIGLHFTLYENVARHLDGLW